jgi:hypothetical protein
MARLAIELVSGPAGYCDIHHLRHKEDGGETSVENCVLACQFHHDVCIHRRGWQLILHSDGTTEPEARTAARFYTAMLRRTSAPLRVADRKAMVHPKRRHCPKSGRCVDQVQEHCDTYRADQNPQSALSRTIAVNKPGSAGEPGTPGPPPSVRPTRTMSPAGIFAGWMTR